MKSKMTRALDKLRIITYTVAHNIRNRKYVPFRENNGKRIGIIFQQIFGDAILFSSTFAAYAKLFPASKGYDVKLLCLPTVKAFLEANVDIPPSITLEPLDFKKLINNYQLFVSTVKRCNAEFDITIVPGSSASAEILMAACNIPTKVGLVQHKERKWPPYLSIIQKMAYTEIVRPPEEMMVLERHRFFLNEIGLKDYKSNLPILKRKPWTQKSGKYCVMAPGASKKEKCWPIERFAIIADYITATYNMDIYVCGGKEEKEYATKLLELSNSDKIRDLTGTTSFSDWSAVIQNAELVVGNDSATLHIAAASCRKSICIAGLYDKGHFFPYKVDCLRAGERLPRTLLTSMPCEYCRTIGYYSGFGNKKCKKRIDIGECSLCIDAISVEDVKQAIDQLMKEEANE